MKKITNWYCEVCGRRFKTFEEGSKHNCSIKGVPYLEGKEE